LFALGLVLAVATALLPWEQFGAPFLVILLGACGLTAWVWVDAGPGDRRRVLLFVGTALLLRIVAAGLFNGWLGPQGLWNDSITYDRIGWALAQAWHSGSASPAGLGALAYLAAEPFSNVVGVVYFLLGHSPAAMVAFNCLLGAGTVYLTYCLAVPLAGRDVAWLAGWMAALYSGFWVFSLMILKDGLTLFMLLFFLVSFYRLVFVDRLSPSSILWLALAAGCGLFLKDLRDYVWVLAGFAALLVVLARLSQVRRGRWAVALIGLVIIGGLIGVAPRLAHTPISWASLGSGTFLASYLKELPPSGTVLDLVKWTSIHPVAFAEFAGLSIISSALAPYAWILPGSIPGTLPFNAYTVSYLGMWIWYFLLPFSVIGAAVGLRRAPGRFVPVLALAVLLFLLFALTIPRESRHRDMVMPILLLLGAQGIASGWKWRQWGWVFWAPLFVAAAVKIQAVPSLAVAAACLAVLLGALILRKGGGQARVAPT
jgi:hypothetical protein